MVLNQYLTDREGGRAYSTGVKKSKDKNSNLGQDEEKKIFYLYLIIYLSNFSCSPTGKQLCYLYYMKTKNTFPRFEGK